MAASIPFFFSLFLLSFSLSSLFTRAQSNIDICPNSFCSDDPHAPLINFPFYLKNHRNQSCGYNTSFEISCINKAILNLPNLGGGGSDFIVQEIDYDNQILWLSDPDGCFTSRLLNSTFNHDFSPFRAVGTRNFTFLNCSRKIGTAGELDLYYEPVSCLSGENHTVLGVEEGRYNGSWSNCTKIGIVAAPVFRPPSAFHSEMYNGISLTWDLPECSACAVLGGECVFKRGSDPEIDCMVLSPSSTSKSTGLPRSAKYGIIIGVGIPALLCLIGLGCFICSKINYYVRCRRQRNADPAVFSIPIRLQPYEVEMGLDRPTIESYPKTKLGQSGRLPKPNDTTCSVCLSDYQPEETLRTIPECGHYFHIGCIDEWLKVRGTCPLCRNSPDGSIFTATSLSPSSSSVLSMSSA